MSDATLEVFTDLKIRLHKSLDSAVEQASKKFEEKATSAEARHIREIKHLLDENDNLRTELTKVNESLRLLQDDYEKVSEKSNLRQEELNSIDMNSYVDAMQVKLLCKCFEISILKEELEHLCLSYKTQSFPPSFNNFVHIMLESNESQFLSKLIDNTVSRLDNELFVRKISMALYKALEKDKLEIGFFLLKLGADVSLPIKDCNGMAVIHLIAMRGMGEFLEEILEITSTTSHREIVDAKDSVSNRTALHLAAVNGRSIFLRFLLQQGANPFEADRLGFKPIDMVKNCINEVSSGSSGCCQSHFIRNEDNKDSILFDLNQTLSLLEDANILLVGLTVRANGFYTEAKFEDALETFYQAISIIPQNYSSAEFNHLSLLYFNTGIAAAKLGLNFAAIEHYTMAIDIRKKENDDYDSAIYQRALSLSNTLQFDSAKKDLRTLLFRRNEGREHWKEALNSIAILERQSKDHYFVLGIPPTATSVEMKKAYHHKCLEFHPDKNFNLGSNKSSSEFVASLLSVEKNKMAELHFKRIREAYEVLKNKDSRTLYDMRRMTSKLSEIHCPTPVAKSPSSFNFSVSKKYFKRTDAHAPERATNFPRRKFTESRAFSNATELNKRRRSRESDMETQEKNIGSKDSQREAIWRKGERYSMNNSSNQTQQRYNNQREDSFFHGFRNYVNKENCDGSNVEPTRGTMKEKFTAAFDEPKDSSSTCYDEENLSISSLEDDIETIINFDSD